MVLLLCQHTCQCLQVPVLCIGGIILIWYDILYIFLFVDEILVETEFEMFFLSQLLKSPQQNF